MLRGKVLATSSRRGAQQIFACLSKCDSHQHGVDSFGPPLGTWGERIRAAILPYAIISMDSVDTTMLRAFVYPPKDHTSKNHRAQ